MRGLGRAPEGQSGARRGRGPRADGCVGRDAGQKGDARDLQACGFCSFAPQLTASGPDPDERVRCHQWPSDRGASGGAHSQGPGLPPARGMRCSWATGVGMAGPVAEPRSCSRSHLPHSLRPHCPPTLSGPPAVVHAPHLHLPPPPS